MQPPPPWPASTRMSTSSTNMQTGQLRAEGWKAALLFYREDADFPAARTMIFEPHASVDLGEDRVVLAQAGVQAGQETPPALADDDRSARDNVAVMALDAKPLRIAIASVA